MHQLSAADRVWNRAALDAGGSAPHEGDRALAALLLAHGMIMNGGVDHAVDALSADELSAAVRGYKFFGLDDAAGLLSDATAADELQLEEATRLYSLLIPNDGTLAGLFKRVYVSLPNAFAPLEAMSQDA
jgi:hypothetical protein